MAWCVALQAKSRNECTPCMDVLVRAGKSGCVDHDPVWKRVKQTEHVLGN